MESSKKILKTVLGIPVLFTAYNRLEYTKESLPSLLKSNCGKIYVFDNGSTDGTVEWLKSQKNEKLLIHFSDKNVGVSGAMNWFFNETRRFDFIAKVDNDTVVKKEWLELLLKAQIAEDLDIVQAKHPILKLSHKSGNFDEWMKTKNQSSRDKFIYFSDHVGGTGILIKNSDKLSLEKSSWALGGWDKFQEANPNLRKAFYAGTELELLDSNQGEVDYTKFPDYYYETGRLQQAELVKQAEWIEHLEKDILQLRQELDLFKKHKACRAIVRLSKILNNRRR